MAFIIAYIVDMYVYRLGYPTSYTYVPGDARPGIGATAERCQLHTYMAFIIAYVVDMYVYRLVYPTSYTYVPGSAGPAVGAAAERRQL